MTTSAIDTAKAANTLLGFSRDDQQALLEVMTDYFTSPEEGRESDSDKDSITDDRQHNLEGTAKINIKTLIQ